MKRFCLLFAAGLVLLSILAPMAVADVGETYTDDADPSAPPGQAEVGATGVRWLEPQGLNIVDLVGLVPEENLQGAILSFTPGYGIVTYDSGTRVGDTVTIRATVFPRYVKDGVWSGSMFGCLGQPARIDQWGSVAPATTVRLYHGGKEVTSDADLYSYVPAGRALPVRNPKESEYQNRYRYWEKGEASLLPTSFTSDGALRLPANMGCEVIMSYTNYGQLTAVFTAQVPQRIDVTVMGTQDLTFRSYVGPGYTGLLTGLMGQLHDKYGSRHSKLGMNIPAGADYLFLNFPKTPVDAYTRFPDNPYDNVDRPSSGTYRIDGAGLSVDHVNSMGLPLYGHWKDIGDSGYEYLPHFQQPTRLAAPEYVIPDGVAYDPCMLSGTCPDSVLSKIWETPMRMRVAYLRVERVTGGMDQIPLRMVGPNWYPSTAAASQASAVGSGLPGRATLEAVSSPADSWEHQIYFPLALRPAGASIPPDEPGDRPFGWFTQDGRMLDFVGVQQ